jgi:signal transduction histidine kinase/CheY-like chemotaxis protein
MPAVTSMWYDLHDMDESINILLVDDHSANRLVLREILRRLPYTCIEAPSGEEALDIVAKQRVDLILLDVCMPAMDGFECAAILHAQPQTRNIPILFVTALATQESHSAKAYSLGAVDYLVKPLDVSTVRHRVAVFANQVLLRRRVQDQEVLLRDAQKDKFEHELSVLRLASDPRYQKLVSGIGRTIEWSVDSTHWRLTFVSQQAQKVFNIDASNFSQNEFFQRNADPQERQTITDMFETVVRTGEDQSCEHRLISGTGEVMWLHTGVGVLTTQPPQSQELHGVSVDITALKQKEFRQGLLAKLCLQSGDLQDHRAILQRLLPLTVPGLADWCVIDELISPTTVRQLGSAHRDPASQGLLRTLIQPREVVLGRGRGLAQVVSDGEPRSFSDFNQCLPLATILSTPLAAPLYDLECYACLVVPLQARNRVFGTVTFGKSGTRRTFHPEEIHLANELCQRVALLADNAILHKESLHAQTMRERLLTIVAHDLRNPLFSISTNATLLLNSPTPAVSFDRSKRLGTKIKQVALHMSGLIDDLLDFGRVTQGALKVDLGAVNVQSLFDEVLSMLQPVAENQNRRLVIGGAERLTIRADKNRLVQIFANLIGNAVKFSEADSIIYVDAKQIGQDIEFSVKNSGEPIASDHIDHIFDTFYRGDHAHNKGLGLGLHIVRGLVEAQGGKIWLRSSLASGTCFYFSLHTTPPVDVAPPLAAVARTVLTLL